MKAEELVAGALGLLGLTQIAFIGLKIAEVIDWSWGWVLAPLWMPIVLFIAFLCLCLVFTSVEAIFMKD